MARYTFVTPFGSFTSRQDGRQLEDTAGPVLRPATRRNGPIDHFLTSSTAPAGFYGNG